ncbi:hypothetical protein RB2946 [Rhodopirellula baltica SH 1]|uniref:Uncharacterized protein n=1 Tax=Rhodopirellula baltica (strain DSM 10527 / NCIMB 13988 / SH1) TaxID=243090 RepID=Q7UV11_RHOBA|nr:hypothetical protein RB2946 [Rhodopirellula baltica SH 1]
MRGFAANRAAASIAVSIQQSRRPNYALRSRECLLGRAEQQRLSSKCAP